MPYGQSPWESAAASTQGLGNSMARIAQAQQMGRMRAQQFAAQMALRQQQEQLQQQRVGVDQQRLQAQTPEYQARTAQAQSVADKNNQGIGRQNEMDDLARAVAANVFQQRIPGGEGAVLSGDITGTPGPTREGADVLNQGDLVRNTMQLIAMHNPNELSTMMMGKNIPQGDVNYNPLTQDRVQGLPPRAPTGAPIDPLSGMTSYQLQALLMQKARQADAEKRTQMMMEKLHNNPEYMMNHPDEGSGDSGGQDGTGGSGQGGKPLDADTAKKFLQQSGGDKEKARALAKQQGYTF